MFGGHNDDAAREDAGAATPTGTIDAGASSAVMAGAPAAPVVSGNDYTATVEPDASAAAVAPDVATDALSATSGAPAVVAPSGQDDSLLQIKQQALQQLSPLIGHLDQSPEDRFRTTMMMIQASDDQGLIKDAYAAAQQIPDEKVRAQALLDIVNEINYFTQQAHAGTEPNDAAA